MPNKKGFALILILLVVVVVVSIAVVSFLAGRNLSWDMSYPSETQISSPTQALDPTESWKKINSELGFSFRYPSEKFIDCGLSNAGIQLWDLPFDCPTAHDIFYRIGILVYKPGEYIPDRAPFKSESVFVGGKSVKKNSYRYTVDDGPAFPEKEYTEVVINLNKSILRVQLLGESAENKTIFDQILSTFKFTENNKSDLQSCPLSYKFYENNIFSICYPINFSATTITNPNAFGQEGLYSTSVVFEGEKEIVKMSTRFEGGWGGLNCESKQISVSGYKTRVLIWDKDESAPCGPDLTNLVAVIGEGTFDRSTPFQISLDYQRKAEQFLSREIFETMLSSFKLK